MRGLHALLSARQAPRVTALVPVLALAWVAAGLGASVTGWLLLALAGSSLGFLLFNYPPSSIFMGDVGSTAIGFLFGVLPLLPEAHPVPFEPVALAISLFFLDATFTLVRRMAAGEKWYTPHRTHLYQRPVGQGVSHGVVLLWAAAGMVAVSGCAAAWPRAPGQLRLGLTAVPFVLLGVAKIAVRRLERRA